MILKSNASKNSQKKFSAYPLRTDFMRKSLEREYSNVDLTVPIKKPDPPKEQFDSKTSKKTDKKSEKPAPKEVSKKDKKSLLKGKQPSSKKVNEIVKSEKSKPAT